MPKQQVMKFTKHGAHLYWIASLEELKGYSVEKIEHHEALGHHTSSPADDIFLKKGDETYRINTRSFKHLKHDYQTSGKKDGEIDKLIEAVEEEMKSSG